VYLHLTILRLVSACEEVDAVKENGKVWSHGAFTRVEDAKVETVMGPMVNEQGRSQEKRLSALRYAEERLEEWGVVEFKGERVARPWTRGSN
jgi:phage terminase large subunit-like protein